MNEGVTALTAADIGLKQGGPVGLHCVHWVKGLGKGCSSSTSWQGEDLRFVFVMDRPDTSRTLTPIN